MKHTPKRVGFGCVFLLLLGIAMVSFGWIHSLMQRPLLQYVSAYPVETEDAKEWEKLRDDVRTGLGDAADAVCITAYADHVNVSAGAVSQECRVIAGSRGMFDVYPEFLLDGYLPSDTELGTGERTAAIDEKLAFRLFANEGPVGHSITLGGNEYRVTGVFRADKDLYAGGTYTVCIPIASGAAIRYDSAVLSAAGISGTELFLTAVTPVWPADGTLFDLNKEIMRASMSARTVLYIAALFFVVFAGRYLLRYSHGSIAKMRDEIRRKDWCDIRLKVISSSVLLLLLYASYAAALCFAIIWISRPLYVFTERIPADLSKWSAYISVVNDLIRTALSRVKIASPQISSLRIDAALVTRGTILILLAICVSGFRTGRKRA